ncbi:MAG: 2-oxo acid dehydrogenase subunit E2, partial [Phycisphaerales bacterium]|nr:2-oxo acid dehydrogenase subunit E2 [Phycisphaerales bacterium]
MSIDIVIPSLGESITEVRLGRWLCEDGDWVDRDTPLVEIESDKVTQELPAPDSGRLSITQPEGADLPIGAEIGSIDTSAARPVPSETPVAPHTPAESTSDIPATRVEVATETAAAGDPPLRSTPMARRLADERGVSLTDVAGSGPAGRVMKSDVLATAAGTGPPPDVHPAPTRGLRRERLSPLRKRIAERLVLAQRTAAMLTTFNEADMSEVMRLRSVHKNDFHDRFGVKLGFMSFFAKAVVSGLEAFPTLNAWIDGDEVEYHDYVDLSIAVGTDRGLVVPVVRDAQDRSFAAFESEIAR